MHKGIKDYRIISLLDTLCPKLHTLFFWPMFLPSVGCSRVG
jgi:hypothetical protein